jgi:hypothetical protein
VLESVLLLLPNELFKRASGLRLSNLDRKNVIPIIAAHPTVELKYDWGLRRCCRSTVKLCTRVRDSCSPIEDMMHEEWQFGLRNERIFDFCLSVAVSESRRRLAVT